MKINNQFSFQIGGSDTYTFLSMSLIDTIFHITVFLKILHNPYLIFIKSANIIDSTNMQHKDAATPFLILFYQFRICLLERSNLSFSIFHIYTKCEIAYEIFEPKILIV